MKQKASLLYIDQQKADFDAFEEAVQTHPYFKWRFEFRLVWAQSFRQAISILSDSGQGLIDVVFFDSRLAEPSQNANAHQRIQQLKSLVGSDAVIALPHPSDTHLLQQILNRYVGEEQIIDLDKEEDRLLQAIEGLVLKKRTNSDFDMIRFDLLKRDTELRIELEGIKSRINQVEQSTNQQQRTIDRLDHGADTINQTLLQGSESIASVVTDLRRLVARHDKEFDQISKDMENLADADAVGELLANLQSQIQSLEQTVKAAKDKFGAEKLVIHRERMKYIYGILAMIVAALLSAAVPGVGKLIEAISSIFGG